MSTLRAVCKCFIHAHQKLEKPKHQHQPSNSWWMDKKNCGRTHTWNTISTHSKKKGHMTDMCNIMGKSRMPSLRERNQTQKALYVMISFLWHSVRGKKTTYIHVLTKHIGETQGEGRYWLQGGTRGCFGVMEMFFILIMMVILQPYVPVKIY